MAPPQKSRLAHSPSGFHLVGPVGFEPTAKGKSGQKLGIAVVGIFADVIRKMIEERNGANHDFCSFVKMGNLSTTTN
ncbi:hypothetical protein [Neisseria leonii]|uniref:hypothetical protein n=1 Tax=Neisseria leonii TaxID=2995413 RepID=UPI00237BC880|nr:hypothetical protein [Neisseria sp. 3986]MDD9326588.1 hypothetical protein [Neisseria sp. 3986]